MENKEEKKQNNRKEDEKRQEASNFENSTKPSEKEWDPMNNTADDSENVKKKIKSIKGVRISNDADKD
ncbi:hypothetical protein BXY82_2550 [Gelidibacter sediminis]|uniref:Uncharacterized protein n=1 Tax=Gelidibacter sediminis TaxID=1608710 RepID=A0A4R7Q200_9FLAO|nr:hypothetical protein [Gelidibacter sediminis]TDU40500.1 hypothetical protein BXY82_2550 [Gelidibacter sediminis]